MILAKFCQIRHVGMMATMNISLPDSLKSFVNQKVVGFGYGTSSEYVRELIRRDRDRDHFRQMVLDGANSGEAGVADDAYFAELRALVRGIATE